METPDTFDLVTIITPIFNGEEFLSACIESVIGQTYPCWELILVDDGSTDSSGEICRRYAEQDERINYVGLPHAGVSAARNAALEQARGEYIFFLDCDDLIHPRLIETQVGLMQQCDASMAAECFSTVDAAFQLPAQLDTEVIQCPKYICRYASSVSSVLYRTFSLDAIGGKMFCRKAIDENSFPIEWARGEDTIFIGDVLSFKDISVILIETEWYYRRLHTHNVTNNRLSDAHRQKFLDIVAERIQSCQESGLENAYWKRKYTSYVIDWCTERRIFACPQYPKDQIDQYVFPVLRHPRFFKLSFKQWVILFTLAKCFPAFLFLRFVYRLYKWMREGVKSAVHSRFH